MTVEEQSHKEAAKRRIMFVPGEDFYFLAYTTILLLQELGSTSPQKQLVDVRKVAYLAELLGSDAYLRGALAESELDRAMRSRLSLLYDRGVARRAPLERVVAALERRGWLTVSRRPDHSDCVYLADQSSYDASLKDALYDGERARIRLLRTRLTHLRTMTLATLKARLFESHGVRTWGE